MGTRADEFDSKPVITLRRVFVWGGIAALVLLIGATAIGVPYYWKALMAEHSLTSEQLGQRVWWRAHLFARKATGKVPDLTWGDLIHMTRQRGGFDLDKVALGVSPEGSVKNPFNTDEDREAATSLFGSRCSMCHGAEGGGWNAPTLNHPGLKHGDSDLAIYKVLRDGIPGTAMIRQDLSRTQRWQLVGYIKTMMVHGENRASAAKPRSMIEAPIERIFAAGSRTDEWLTYSGTFDGRRYSPLNEITPENASRLRVLWIQQFNTIEPVIEATPIVLDGMMFMTEPPSNVVAMDAKTGSVIWRYDRPVAADLALCCGRVNRGVALLGHTLFLGALDGYLVAINANTGKMMWETRVADPTDNFSMTGAPLVIGHSIVAGVAGGDFGIRGFLAAYDVDTGKPVWKFDTVPGPGQPGNESWKNDAWKTGGGATWITGAYDRSLDLLYWGVGNPAPDFNGDSRPGDNLYTNSVIAIQGSTGKLVWHFQFTPHDEHDWDATQTPILTDITIDGQTRKVICWANRNGFYYVLDRTNGKFLAGTPFVEQNWAKSLDPNGRPILSDGNSFSSVGRLTRPAYAGGTNWQNPALDPTKGLFFVTATEGASVFTKSIEVPKRDVANKLFLSSGAVTPEALVLVVRALEVATGKKKWEYFAPPLSPNVPYSYSGLLATGGGLLFGASGGSAFAVDSSTGKEVWRVSLGGDTRAAPITFTIDGHQVIAISGGRSVFLFGL